MNENNLFQAALTKPQSERNAFLDAACVGNPDLRVAVEKRLAAHFASHSSPDDLPAALEQTVDSASADGSGPHSEASPTSMPAFNSGSTAGFRPDVEPGLVI